VCCNFLWDGWERRDSFDGDRASAQRLSRLAELVSNNRDPAFSLNDAVNFLRSISVTRSQDFSDLNPLERIDRYLISRFRSRMSWLINLLDPEQVSLRLQAESYFNSRFNRIDRRAGARSPAIVSSGCIHRAPLESRGSVSKFSKKSAFLSARGTCPRTKSLRLHGVVAVPGAVSGLRRSSCSIDPCRTSARAAKQQRGPVPDSS